jgi:hypothetical protein
MIFRAKNATSTPEACATGRSPGAVKSNQQNHLDARLSDGSSIRFIPTFSAAEGQGGPRDK